MPDDGNGGREPLREYVYKTILEQMLSGHLQPGDRIRELDVVQSLGVSRTPVREALQLLSSRRYLENVPNHGLVVAKPTRQQFLQLYAVREILEGASARFAAQHAVAAEIALMHQILDEFSASEDDVEKLVRLDSALHQTIYEAARNEYIKEFVINVVESLTLLRQTTFTVPGRHASADREHRAIVAAIESRDAEGAEGAARLHVRESQRIRLRMISSF